MDTRKNKILLVIGILAMLLAVVGATFAFFIAQDGESDIKDVNVTTATTDLLTFNIANSLSLTNLNQTSVASDATKNESASTIATAKLIANSAANAEPQQYYMYLVVSENPLIYTKDSNNPELLLKLEYNNTDVEENYVEITNSNKADYQGISLEGLTYKTVNSGTARETSGWDITTETFIKIIENRAINASKDTTTTDKYRVTITFVNLVDQDQQENTGKTYNGELVLQKEEMPDPNAPKYWNDGLSDIHYIFPNLPDTTYASVAELREGYGSSNFDSKPYYIKTTKTGHLACLFYNNREFCLEPNYWIGDEQDKADGSSTMAKLQADMINILGITTDDISCYSGYTQATCGVHGSVCNVHETAVSCTNGGFLGCYMTTDGNASCSPG